MDNSHPINRLSTESLSNIKFVAQKNLPADTKQAYEANFTPDLLPAWEDIEKNLLNGWVSLHELRSSSSGLLLSAKLMVNYTSRKRGEKAFALTAWSATPDNVDGNPEQGKGKGYGSLLLEKSVEAMRKQNPHIFALVSEQEFSGKLSTQEVKRGKWKSENGLRLVLNLNYEIPPFAPVSSSYVEVAKRSTSPKAAQLLIRRFDGLRTVDSKDVISIVQRLYSLGYGIKSDDAYFLSKAKEMSSIDSFELE